MSEEFITQSEESDEKESSPKKRITKRKVGITDENKAAAIPEKNEISAVLTKLYKDETEEDLETFEVKKDGNYKIPALLSFLVLIAAVIWAGFFLMPGKTQGNSDVALDIKGSTSLTLGATTTYTISYANSSGNELRNVVLNTYVPDGFVYLSGTPAPSNPGHDEWNLGSLSPYQKGTISITGKNYGSLNEEKSWRVFLNYQPVNFNSKLRKAATLTTAMSSAPVNLTVTGPDQIAVGTTVSYVFSIQQTDSLGSPLFITPILPSNFTLATSSPNLNKDNMWLVPTSTPSSTKRIQTYTLTGKFTDGDENGTPIKGKIILPMSSGQNYEIASAEKTSSLIKNDVSVDLAINGATTDMDSRPGDTLNITARIKNNSSKDISNASLKIVAIAPSDKKQSLLDFAKIVDKSNGTDLGEQVDDFTRRGTVSWTKDQIPALAKIKANAEVSVDIQLPIKDGKAFDLTTVKSNVITIEADANFKDAAKSSQSISTKPISITLGSDLAFTSSEDVSQNGTAEEHTIGWILNNTFHPLKNIVINATAFGNLDFTMQSKGAGDLVFDPKTSQITWTIPEMPLETDVLNCSFSLNLKTKNPSQSLLLSKAHLTAEDTVTGKTIDLALPEIKLND